MKCESCYGTGWSNPTHRDICLECGGKGNTMETVHYDIKGREIKEGDLLKIWRNPVALAAVKYAREK